MEDELKDKLVLLEKEELIDCIEQNGYINDNIEVNYEDIALFFQGNAKSDNDKTNRKREAIIKNILNDKINKKWYSSTLHWYIVALRLKEFVEELKTLRNIDSDLKEVIEKGGRRFNYDFIFVFKNGHQEKVEFKSNVSKIVDYPQILSLYSYFLVKSISYAEYFYDNYLLPLNLPRLPSKQEYLKVIYKDKLEDYPFFTEDLKTVPNMSNLYYKSISEYLENVLEFDFDQFRKKIASQTSKNFMCWKDGKFYLEKLTKDDVDTLSDLTLKKGKNGYNTVIIKTVKGEAELHLLLRWKNGNRFLKPAWDIKLKKNK